MGVAYCLLMLIPPNTIPAAIFLAWLSWRDWPRRQWALSLALPAGAMSASLVVFGWWPSRWLVNLSAQPVQPFFLTTIWRMADQLALPSSVAWAGVVIVIVVTTWAWRRAGPETDLARLMLLISATLVITPYALGYRLAPLVACVMPYLSRWRRDVLAGLYLLTFLPLLRLLIGRDNSWIDLAFVAAVFIASVICAAWPRSQAEAHQE
jgi:hypothetical protein